MAGLLSSLISLNHNRQDRPSVARTEANLPEDPDVAVEVRNVTKAYGNFTALRNVSLEVKRGECLGVVGFNGAGKSTLLQLICGTLMASKGSIKTRGRIVALLELGAGYNDDFTGLENIYMNAAILGVPRDVIDSRLPEIEAFAEIGEFLHKPVRTYSSGMRVRLAFSMLTQVDPEIMIIDEALSVGDAYFSHKCTKVIRRFREEGRTLLFVSHDASAVKTLCDRAVLLDRGAIVRSGTPVSILDYYNAMIATRERDHEIRQLELLRGSRINRSGNRKATIERFELLDQHDSPVRAVLTGSKVRICCVIVFGESLSNPTVGFLIRDRLGNDVFGTNTFFLKQNTGEFANGDKVEISFATNLNLGAGNYSLTLAVHSGASHAEGSYDWCDQLLAFSIIPHWPFEFIGVAALPAEVEMNREVIRLRRCCTWGQRISFTNTGNAHLYQLEGWSFPEADYSWTNGLLAELAFELPDSDNDALLQISAFPFLTPRINHQHVQVTVGSETVSEWKVSEPGEFSCVVPRKLLKGEVRLALILKDAISPVSLGISTDARQLALAISHLTWGPVP